MYAVSWVCCESWNKFVPTYIRTSEQRGYGMSTNAPAFPRSMGQEGSGGEIMLGFIGQRGDSSFWRKCPF